MNTLLRTLATVAALVAPAAVPAQKPEPAPVPRSMLEGKPVQAAVEAVEAIEPLDFESVDFGDLNIESVGFERLKLDDASISLYGKLALETSRLSMLDVKLESLGESLSQLEGKLAISGDHIEMKNGGVVAHGGFATASPREAWAPKDSADSTYRVAREALNRGEYRRASQLFGRIAERWPRSTYAPDALYWQAFALYRIGATEDLRTAIAALDARRARYADAGASEDVATLATRIRGALAARGDASAARSVERTATSQAQTCDKEDLAVRIEALSALSQMDGDAALPVLRRVLARRDPCSASLRRRALYILGRRSEQPSAAATTTELLLDVARNDPDAETRSEATAWLGKVPGDASMSALEELLRTTDDERVQRSAVRALSSSEHPRARQALRGLIEREGAPEKLRLEAIATYDKDKATSEDAAYLRTLYPRLTSAKLRERALAAISRSPTTENQQFLVGVARNPEESVSLRSTAISRLMRMEGARPAEITRLYDQTDDRRLREQLLSAYARHEAPEYTDKLLEIARTGTDPQLRRTAINHLSKKNDPRTTKLLLEIIDQ